MADRLEQLAAQRASNGGAATGAPVSTSGVSQDPLTALAAKREGGSVPDKPLSLTPGTEGSGPTERFVSNFASAVNPVPGIIEMGKEALDPNIGLSRTLGTHLIDPQIDQFSKAKQAAQGKGEFSGMNGVERASSAFGHGLAGMIPLVGPAAANAGDQIGSGDVAGGLGSGAGLISTVAAPEISRGTGAGLMRTAEPLMEHALKIKLADKMFGKTPGRFALDETGGAIRPGTIEARARQRVNDLTGQVDQVYANSSAQGSLTPARDVIDARITQAQAGNSTYAPPFGRGRVPELQQMRQQLTDPGQNFAGDVGPINTPPPGTIGPSGPIKISAFQDPAQLRRMKTEFGKDFTTWNQLHPGIIDMPTARGAYNAMDTELDRVAPEGAELNQRISSGIPVERASQMNALRPSLLPRVFNRGTARTGALAAALYGGHEFGPLGAAAGLILPEIAADPVAQAALAKGVNQTGRTLRRPTTGRIGQIAPNIKEKK
jgi:hypothetical protein